MKNSSKRVTIIGLWIISVAVSFCAGAFLIYEYYIFGDPVSSITTSILVDPPVEGPLYGSEDFVRANNEVKAYLLRQQTKPEFSRLHLRIVVVPERSGYTVYSSSGRRGTPIPSGLYDAAETVLKKSLGNIRTAPIASEPR